MLSMREKRKGKNLYCFIKVKKDHMEDIKS